MRDSLTPANFRLSALIIEIGKLSRVSVFPLLFCL